MKKLDREIVFITDPWEKESSFSIKRKNIEGNSQKAALQILDELNKISDHVVMYNNPQDFSDNLYKHLNSVILNTYYGEASQNSKALIPSLCEINNVEFIGADSYAQMLCNDKHLSKKYISDFGLKTPDGVLIRNERTIDMIKILKLPLVVKPNFGGGSNGISNKNLVYSYQEAQKLVLELLQYQELPILVEEFVPGYEVELVIFGNNKKIYFSTEIGLEVDGIDFFDNQIWGYEAKKAGEHTNKLSPTHQITIHDLKKTHALFQSFGKMEIMRVDCRINNGEVYILELSPDCYLGPTGGVAKAFEHNSINYSDMFQCLIDNSLKSGTSNCQ